VKIKN